MLRIALLLVLVAGAVALALSRAAPSPPPAAPLPTVAPFGERPPGAEAMTLSLDEAGLTAQVNGILSGTTLADTPFGPATFRELAVRVTEGQISASGTAQAGALSLPVSLAFTLEARDGALLVGLRSAVLGAISLPDPALRAVERTVQAPVDQILAQQRVRIHSATLRPGSLVLVAARS